MTYRITSLMLCILFVASSCTSLRQSASGSNKPAPQTTVVNNNPRFLEDISITPEKSTTKVDGATRTKERPSKAKTDFPGSSKVENAGALQFKYAQLLNTEVEYITNIHLFEVIDEWYGTKYCMGGTTKSCIDCSAFVQTVFSNVFEMNIPRTARDQYAASQKISSTMLKEGDLLFYNTRGGVSHVGIYLQNNKFVHASTSGGVMISDMFEPYYVKHFISAGRFSKEAGIAARKK
jgi:cell wall-associated NlpC family hydrolase